MVFAAASLLALLAIYQPMLSLFSGLVVVACVLDVLDGLALADVLRSAVKAVVLCAAAGVVYLILAYMVCLASGIEMREGYNGLSSLGLGPLFASLKLSYETWFDQGFSLAVWSAPLALAARCSILPVMACEVAWLLRRGFADPVRTIVVSSALLLFPVLTNLACLMDGGVVHALMLYASNLIYVLAFCLAQRCVGASGSLGTLPGRTAPARCRRYARLASAPETFCALTALCLVVALLCNVCTANTAYAKKDLEQKATLSLMTELVVALDSTEGYTAGKTPVAVVGTPDLEDVDELGNVERITGLWHNSSVTRLSVVRSYFRYILKRPINIISSVDELAEVEGDSSIAEMPTFPARGSIAWLGDVLVVKLGEY
jgi:hypothetical protein